MTFLGKVLQIDEREQYFKVIASVETGYNTDIYILRISLDKMIPILMLDIRYYSLDIEKRSMMLKIFTSSPLESKTIVPAWNVDFL